MSLDTLSACLEAHSENVINQQKMAVLTGYYAAYYVGAKHPKSPTELMSDLDASMYEQKHVDDVDVEAFKEQERLFNSKYYGQQ